MSTDLMVIDRKNAMEVFRTEKGCDPYLSIIREEIDNFIPDISSKKGRDSIASIAHKVAKAKTYLDGVGKDLVDELKEIPKKIDAERKRVRDTLDAWRDEVRAPLTEWENAESARIKAHENAIEAMMALSYDTENLNSANIKERLDSVEIISLGEHWEEFAARAGEVHQRTINALRKRLDDRLVYESEQAELEKLRCEAEKRAQLDREAEIAREAAQKAKDEAEKSAREVQLAAVKREAEEKAAAELRESQLKLQAERAERERAEAILQLERAEAKERDRIKADEEKKKAEADALERNKQNIASINRAAMNAMVNGGIPENYAKIAIQLIAKEKIPNVRMSYSA